MSETITMIWFFFVLTYSGDVIVPRTYNTVEECQSHRDARISQGFAKSMREVSECIGYPIKKLKMDPKSKKDGI